MSSRRKQKRQESLAATESIRKRPRFFYPILSVSVGILAIAGLAVLSAGPTPVAKTPAASAETVANSPISTAPADKADFRALRGKWARTDGDYLLEIRAIDASGKVEAGYYNPQPIRIARADAQRDGAAAKLFLELRDAGYPGCTYTLRYESQDDLLKGSYFQAALHETFDVVFERVK